MVKESLSNKVLLVVPPFSSTMLPNLGVGQLKANLEQAGYPTSVLYLNITFATRIGLDVSEWISNRTFQVLIGEFLFSTVLFDNSPERIEQYVSEVLVGTGLYETLLQRYPDRSPVENISRWCEQAREFCDGEALDAILSSGASVVGFSSSFQQNCAALALLTRLKNRRPEVVSVLGGANCSGEMGEELLNRFAEIDYVGEGECDQSLVTLMQRIDAGNPAHDISGIYSRHPLAIAQPSRPLSGSDLDALPYPDFDEYFEHLSRHGIDKYLQPSLAMETARGCWWGAKHHCTFCGLNQDGMHFRSKSPERALEEIDWLVDRYGEHVISVADNILDMQYFKTVLPELAETRRTSFFYETKSNLSREQVRTLAEARVNSIQPGIESLSDESLRLMRKGCSKAQNLQLLKWCAEYGVQVGWNYLIGFPGEDEKEFSRIARESELLYHLEPPASQGVLRVDRFSPYFNEAEEFGLAPLSLASPYQHVYPFADESLMRIAYFFESEYLKEKASSASVDVVQSMVKRWSSKHGRSFLLAISRHDSLVIIDTRPCARRWIHRLKGLRRAIYEYCDTAHSLSRITKAMDDGVSFDEVEKAVESLVRDRLLLGAGNRYVSLGVMHNQRLTYENPPAQTLTRQRPGRRARMKQYLPRLGQLVRHPRKMAPRVWHGLGNAWRRRQNRLVRRIVLSIANRVLESRVNRI